MLDVVIDTLVDAVKLLPFLFVTYLVMEMLEHRTSTKAKRVIKNSGKAGPFFGTILGAFPQCGFSAAASNLFSGRVITLGTLIAIYLSTSDEMIPVFLSEHVELSVIVKILLLKIVIGMIAGFLIDYIMRKIRRNEDITTNIGHMCDHDHCHCSEEGVLKSSIRHTAVILAYIIAISFVLNVVIYYVGEDTLGSLILNRPILGSMIATIVGLIPNCAASVVITQLYLGGVMSFGAMMSGLLAGAGVGILVLFKENQNKKENIKILGLLYIIGVICGILIDALGILL